MHYARIDKYDDGEFGTYRKKLSVYIVLLYKVTAVMVIVCYEGDIGNLLRKNEKNAIIYI